jgi:hypothetical protein
MPLSPARGKVIPLWFSDLMMEDGDRQRERVAQAEKIVLALRRRLIELDPSVPRNEYDGNAWAEYERV